MVNSRELRVSFVHHSSAGCCLLAKLLPVHAQFAQRVLSEAGNYGQPARVPVLLQQATEGNATEHVLVQPGIKLPSCPMARLLSTRGVPERWRFMSMRQQVSHPINAMMLQLVSGDMHGEANNEPITVYWQRPPAAVSLIPEVPHLSIRCQAAWLGSGTPTGPQKQVLSVQV